MKSLYERPDLAAIRAIIEESSVKPDVGEESEVIIVAIRDDIVCKGLG